MNDFQVLQKDWKTPSNNSNPCQILVSLEQAIFGLPRKKTMYIIRV